MSCLAEGVPIELGTRAFDLLLVLLEADGALVTKEELLSRVWQGVVVAEENLKVQIAALRKALGKGRDFYPHRLRPRLPDLPLPCVRHPAGFPVGVRRASGIGRVERGALGASLALRPTKLPGSHSKHLTKMAREVTLVRRNRRRARFRIVTARSEPTSPALARRRRC